MQNANEILKNILFVLGKIEAKTTGSGKTDDKKSSSKKEGGDTKQIVNIATALSSFATVKDKTKTSFLNFSKELMSIVSGNKVKSLASFGESLYKLSLGLANLATGLDALAGGARWGKTNRALNVLRKLYDLMIELGNKEGDVDKAINVFDKLSKSLQRLAEPMKTLALFMAYVGLSFVVFAGGLMLSAMILGSTNPLAGLAVLLLTMGVLVLFFMGMTLIGPLIDPGIKTIKNMGKALLFLILGIVVFALGLLAIASILGMDGSPGVRPIVGAFLLMLGVVLFLGAMFFFLGLLDKSGAISKGVKSITGMGFGLFILILAVYIFAVGLIGIAALLGQVENGWGVVAAIAVMAAVVVGLVFLFRILGDNKTATTVAKGALVAILMAVALVAIAISMMFLAEAANRISGLLKTGSSTDINVPGIVTIPGGIVALGAMAIILVASIALFAILGIPVVAGLVALGAATGILVALSLVALSYAVMSIVEASKNIPDNLGENICKMIQGLIGGPREIFKDGKAKGILGGIEILTEGAKGPVGFVNFTKNSIKLMAAVAMLMAASVALSMFASALGAFAKLDSMRPIIGTDSNGKPIFGEPVNITNVSQNIATSISGFITALIASTKDLSISKAVDLKIMSSILTGEDGLLSAVNQFAEVLKTFGQFGAKNEIGYTSIDPKTGEQIYGSVSVTTVAENIASSFMTFVTTLFNKGKDFSMSGWAGMKMMALSEILMGSEGTLGFGKEPGLFKPIFKFAELLKMFTGAGDKKISFLDDKGQIQSVDPAEAARLLLGGITAFVTTISSTEFDESSVEKFGDLMEKIGDIDKIIPKLMKISTNLTNLSKSIDLLTKSMKGFVKEANADKYIKFIKDIAQAEKDVAQAKSDAELRNLEKINLEDLKQRKAIQDAGTEKIVTAVETAAITSLSKDTIESLTKAIVDSMKGGDYTFKFMDINNATGKVVFKV